MTPEQEQFYRVALSGLKSVSVARSQPHDTDSLTDVLQSAGIQSATINIASLTAIGFTPPAMAAIGSLAKSYRSGPAGNSQKSNNEAVAKQIAEHMVQRWRERVGGTPTPADFIALDDAVDALFAALTTVRRHLVPCVLFPHPLQPFSVGAVAFYPLRDFPTDQFGVPADQVWPKPPSRFRRWRTEVWAALRERKPSWPRPGGFMFDDLIALAVTRGAGWTAVVEVSGRAPAQSTITADFAADIALAAIQLICPGPDMRKVTRATGRAAPVGRSDVSKEIDGQLSTGLANHHPALARSPELIAVHLAKAAPFLQSMGRRLTAYLSGDSALPRLDESWCNAAYWYHEALAETLDTVSIAKLETAIEVLFRAESMPGSKARVVQSFDALFGLNKGDAHPLLSGLTVEQFADAITAARSRVLHGTWPTLHPDPPISKGKPSVTYVQVEAVTRLLLLEMSLQLDAYGLAGQTADTIDGLAAWVKGQRPNGSTLKP